MRQSRLSIMNFSRSLHRVCFIGVTLMPQLSTDPAFKNSSDALSTSRRENLCRVSLRLLGSEEDVSKLEDFRTSTRGSDRNRGEISLRLINSLAIKEISTRVSIHFAAFQGQSSSR